MNRERNWHSLETADLERIFRTDGAKGLSDKEAACVIRVSIGRHTTADQLDYARECLESLIAQHTR